MNRCSLAVAALLWVLLAATHAQNPPPTRLVSVLQPFVDRQVIGGAVALVADEEKVLDVAAVGFSSLDTKAAMQTNSLFWLASISKTFTATAMMMLADEGRVNVDDPVEKYLPAFKGQQVADAKEKTQTHPPGHPMVIKELLTHTSGIIGPNDPPIQRNDVLKDDADQYGAAPMKWEPGTKYEYNNSGINTAGRIIEVVSGLPFGNFVKQRLLDPLGMTDTTYWPDEKLAARLVVTSQFNKEKSALEDRPNKPDAAWLNQPPDIPHAPLNVRAYIGDALKAYPNHYAWPAGGLFSTAPDLARFGQLMLNRGVSRGRRFVSDTSFKRMTTVEPCTVSIHPSPGIGLGWFVKLRNDEGPAAGSFGHRGARGPVMWIDPDNRLVMILLIESWDIHQRGEPPGIEQRNLCSTFFRTAIATYGRSGNRRPPSL